jgi:lipopolysaccharide transport system ATP-binding protein
VKSIEQTTQPRATPSRPAKRKMIEIDGVWEEFTLHHDKRTTFKDFLINLKRADYSTFWALKDVSFDIEEGDVFGIIGENGSGKSTLLKCISGIIPPTKGEIRVHGKISPLLELGAGFQPNLTGRENIYLNASILGAPRKEIMEREQEIIDFAELEEFIDTPIRNYSSGMKVRLGFAVAINVNPDILLMDEVLAVGDESFQAKCFEKLDEYRKKGTTIVLVSHSLSQVGRLCNKVAWIDKGELRATGKTEKVIDAYLKQVQDKQEQTLAKAHAVTDETHNTPKAKPEPAPTPIRQQGSTPGRWGTGEALITSVKFYDKNQQERHVFETGKTMVIELSYETRRIILEPFFGIALFTDKGERVFGLISPSSLSKIEKTGSLRLNIPKLTLLRGKYLVSIALRGDNKRAHYDFHDRLYEVEVKSPRAKDANGLVLMEGDWQHADEWLIDSKLT